jgi:hypothetical protein
VSPLLSSALILVTATMFLLYGGIVFALSAAFKGDWLILAILTSLATYLWGRFGDSESVLKTLLYLLPPLNRTTDVYFAVAAGSVMNWGLLAWFGAYGAASVAVGLYVVHKRRMA